MQPEPDYINLEKLPALCRLLSDDVGIPEHVRAKILDSLIHWWGGSTEPFILRDLKGLFLLFQGSSVTTVVVDKLVRLLGTADHGLADRTVELLRNFRSSKESGVEVLLETLKMAHGTSRWRAAIALAELGVQDEIILEYLQGGAPRTVSADRYITRSAIDFELVRYQSLHQSALTGTTSSEKGKALEDLAEYIFLSIPGLNSIARNLRTLAEEIDLAFSNGGDGFWREIGNPFIVECKNLSAPVDAKTIRDFRLKLQTKGLRGGFIITTSRLTKDATIEIRQALSEARVIIALEGDHLASIAKGQEVAKLLEERFYRCRLL